MTTVAKRATQGDRTLRAEQAVEDLKAATREANETIQAAREEVRELKQWVKEAREVVGTSIGEVIEANLEAQLGKMGELIAEHIEMSMAAVDHRFQTVTDSLLGESDRQKRAGDIPLNVMALAIRLKREGDNAGLVELCEKYPELLDILGFGGIINIELPEGTLENQQGRVVTTMDPNDTERRQQDDSNDER